ncbi:MAG: hypothetical protein PW999_00580 [Paraburkholderia tropica]|nr:hypothetical protein [Paraburkholderia tropica]
MKRLREFSEAHPLLSALAGMAVLFLFALAMLPPDPPYVDQPHHFHKGAV